MRASNTNVMNINDPTISDLQSNNAVKLTKKGKGGRLATNSGGSGDFIVKDTGVNQDMEGFQH